MQLFKQLCIETQSDCTRKCISCLRQTYINKDKLSNRFKKIQLQKEVIIQILLQARDMGFRGRLCLNHFNEPLLDSRLMEIIIYAKGMDTFSEIVFNTNGDLLDQKMAGRLNGVVDKLFITLYDNQEQRKNKILTWFQKTKILFGGKHVVTHFSPFNNLQDCIRNRIDKPCIHEAQERMIILHSGEMTMCCDDICGEFDLGNVYDKTIGELWFSEEHQNIISLLSEPGGRRLFRYCSICPRK